MSDGSEFQVCGAATENARRANSVRVLAADSSGASEDRSGRTGTAGWMRMKEGDRAKGKGRLGLLQNDGRDAQLRVQIAVRTAAVTWSAASDLARPSAAISWTR